MHFQKTEKGKYEEEIIECRLSLGHYSNNDRQFG